LFSFLGFSFLERGLSLFLGEIEAFLGEIEFCSVSTVDSRRKCEFHGQGLKSESLFSRVILIDSGRLALCP
jgi:hypothetical protein